MMNNVGKFRSSIGRASTALILGAPFNVADEISDIKARKIEYSMVIDGTAAKKVRDHINAFGDPDPLARSCPDPERTRPFVNA